MAYQTSNTQLVPAAAMHRSEGGSGSMVFPSGEDNHGTEEERCLAKKPRVQDDDEELLTNLKGFRNEWVRMVSQYVGPLDATTDGVGPMYYTDSGPPRFGGIAYDAMEIFYLKVDQIEGGLGWPLHVYGLVAVRDSMDSKRNILFQRSKNNCQVLTPEDPFLELTGPSRAIALIDPPDFEIELYVPCRRPSEEKVLCAQHFQYNCIGGEWMAGQIQTIRESTKRRSIIELKFAHLRMPLEATIEVYHRGGTNDFYGRFFAHMDYMDTEEVVLLDSKERKVTVLPDGRVLLSRRVVLVEEHDVLRLGVKAWQSRDGRNGVEDVAKFIAKIWGKSDGALDVGFCKMSVSVAWSVLV